MRIAFPIEWNAYSSSGVLTKVEAQVRAWVIQGHEARIFAVTPRDNNPLAIDSSITTPIFFPLPFRKRQFFNKLAVFSAVGRHLKEYAPDIIYYRQSLWYPGQISNMRRIAPYVVELNSLPVEEFRMRSRLMWLLLITTQSWLLNSAAGFVAVSNEICQLNSRYGKPIAVVPNGYPVTSCEPRTPQRHDRPQLVFVGTPNQPWHGLDKILKMADQLPDWDFHVVGPEASEIPGSCLPNLKVHGYMQHAQLVKLYSNMDIGIGTLALHRKNMEEASPLKVREYVAHGLPVIAGYHDSDLSGSDFFLNIGNSENNILKQKDAICAFVERWKGKSINRSEVCSLVDTAAKEARRLAFMESIIADRRQQQKF